MLTEENQKRLKELQTIMQGGVALAAYSSRAERQQGRTRVKARGVPTDVHRRASMDCTLDATARTEPPLNTTPRGWVAHEHMREWGPGLTDYLERLIAGAYHRGFTLHGFCHEHTHTVLSLWADYDGVWYCMTITLKHEE